MADLSREAIAGIVLRWLALVAMSVWLGGFTFYSAFVIPILHDSLGDFEAGLITAKVTNPLNVIGVVTVVLWWVLVFVERYVGGWVCKLRMALLCGTTSILVVLLALHPVMDARLGSGSLEGFYPLHKIYLNASTSQWVVNLALLATALADWRTSGMGRGLASREILR